MNGIHPNTDPREALVARVLAHCRGSQKVVLDKVHPNLPRRHRAFAEHVARRMTGRSVFNEAFAADLETLVELAEAEVERGTVRAEVCDPSPECTSNTTWTESRRTPEAEELVRGLTDVWAFLGLLHAVRDAADAERIVHMLG